MRIASPTRLALLAALPIELANYFIVGYPAGTHLALPNCWFVKVAAQWYLIHLAGVFALNRFDFLRDHAFMGSVVLFLSGYLATALLLAMAFWPVQIATRFFKKLALH
jgi:hypothetical protein